MSRYSAVFSIVTALFCSSALAATTPPPVEAFGKRPMISDVIMSPGGTHFAALQWFDGQNVLAVYSPFSEVEAEKVRMLSLDASKRIEEKVESITWLNDETIGLVFRFESKRGGTPTQETRLVAARYDLSKIRQIPKSTKDSTRIGQIQHRIVDYLDGDPDHILMQLDREGYGQTLNVYSVSLRTGGLKRVTKGGSRVAWYQADQNGRVRLRGSYTEKSVQLQYRPEGAKGWQPLASAPRSEGLDWWPEVFDEDANTLLVSRMNEDGFDEVWSLQLSSNTLGEKVYAHDTSDILSVIQDRYTSKVIGYQYEDDIVRTVYIDPELQNLKRNLSSGLRGKAVSIASYDRDRSQFIIFSYSPGDPGTYYLYSKEGGKLARIGYRNAIQVSARQLGKMKRISYAARDGQSIPAYLTTPPQGSAPYPLVVLPHGGPTARDYLGYDYQVQFLASRGYAVLQPQFRGSTGFGATFQFAGYKQWGLLMQDDITDGARAMIEQGIADPERMCIVGGSYGGYAALTGAVVTPELYQCAVSFAGVSDIRKMIAQDRQYKFATNNPPNTGSRKDDKEQLRDTSPINNIDAIRIPVLLVHGDKDLSVGVDQSKRMAKALKKAGKPYKLVILKDGNHYLELERHRLRFLRELEAFLDKHIGN